MRTSGLSKIKRSQIAMEFLIIMTLVILVFSGFVYLINDTLSEIGLNEDKAEMRNLGESIRNEVMLARSVHANYIRHFEVPWKINGKNYSLDLLDPDDIWKHGLVINVSDNSEYFSLPVDIKGEFVDVVPGFLDYCITKGKSEIAISRNQVGLDYACYDDNCDEDIELNDEGILELDKGDEFSLYLTANCIDDLQTASFDIDHGGFDYKGARQAWDHSSILLNPANIYGDFMFDGSSKKAFFNVDENLCGAGCSRFTISHAGDDGPTGSDALVELVFAASGDAGEYIISIKDVNLVDAQIRDIPPSKQNIRLNIR